MVLAAGGCLYASGCPTNDQLTDVAANSIDSLVTGVVGLFVDSAIDSVMGS
jgi:hypothetical protein